MNSKTLKELAYFFQPERAERPILLLGAGASFRGGVPVASEMVNQITRHAYAIKELGLDPDHATQIMEGDIQRFLKQQPWFKEGQPGEMFPHAVENLLTPSSVRRAFFQSMMGRAKGPTDGHRALAAIVQRQLVGTILTTNFDPFIEDALKACRPHIKDVVTVNRASGDIAAFSPHNLAQVVYLHGAYEYYRDRNSITETQRLDDDLVHKIRNMVSYAPLVVIGYRGYEPSVMEHLLNEGAKDSSNYACGIFWCVRKPEDVHDNVRKLAARIGNNFSLVQIAGFDEALVELNDQLVGRAAYQAAKSSGKDAPAVTTAVDSEIRADLTLDALETDLLIAMAKQYATQILKVDFQATDLERFLEAYSFARRDSKGILRPTLGLYLLVGRDVTDKHPHLKTIVLRDGKHQTVFAGNLLTQFAALSAHLRSNEVNEQIRIKRPEGAVEKAAYSDRAIIELLVNLLAHRDYGSKEFSRVEYDSGQRLSFVAPGGLPPTVFRKLSPRADGKFDPQINVREIRNPVISDVFFAQGHMDKAGTGLVDVLKYMQEHYGSAEFSVGTSNEWVRATLVQAAVAGDTVGRTATPVGEREIYVTNLLPFAALPGNVFSLPLDKPFASGKDAVFFPEGLEDPAKEITWVRHSGALHSFSDFRRYDAFSRRVGYPEYATETTVAAMLADEDKRRTFVQLLGRHWERLLRSKAEAGFTVEYKARRAYFLAKDGGDNTLVYDSPQRKNISRGVVKKRETPTRTYFENEGIAYQIVQFGERWAVQIKPFYVFTREDGKTPLPGIDQTRRATRRYKFDRNKAVDADMKFWALFLSGGKPTLDLGSPALPDLVLGMSYLEAEALDL